MDKLTPAQRAAKDAMKRAEAYADNPERQFDIARSLLLFQPEAIGALGELHETWLLDHLATAPGIH